MKKTYLLTTIILFVILIAFGYGAYHYHALYKKSLYECRYQLSDFDFHYKPEPANYKIVMLGNSFIRSISWDSLLRRNDVVNRGISADRIHCICQRAIYLKDSPAKICFIEGGTNDIMTDPVDTVFAYYERVIETVRSQHKIPVMDMVLYLSPRAADKYPDRKDYKDINKSIQALNIKLKAYAVANHLDYIDLNRDLSDNNNLVLDEKYTLDGLHLNHAAYKIWGEYIQAILQKHGI